MGKQLFDQIVIGTGLPEGLAQGELSSLLERYGLTPETMTLADLRMIVADYMQDVLLELKEKSQDQSGVA